MPSPVESPVETLVSRWLVLRSEGQEVPPEELCRDQPELLPEVESRLGDLGDTRLGNSPPVASPNEQGNPAGSDAAGGNMIGKSPPAPTGPQCGPPRAPAPLRPHPLHDHRGR